MDISLFRSIASQYQDLRGAITIATLDVINRLIEDQVINHQLPVNFFVGFERFSNFSEQVPQYVRLGAVCRRAYVFGVPDVAPPSISGIEFIKLEPDSALAKERFLLVNTPDFWVAMLAREIGKEAVKSPKGGDALAAINHKQSEVQLFDGAWFYDEQVVERVSLLISQVMGTLYQPVRERNYVRQSAHIAEINRRLLGRLEEAEQNSHRRSLQLSTLQQFSAILQPHQPLPCIFQDAVQILSTMFGASDAIIAINLQGEQFMIVSSTGNVSTNQRVSSLEDGASGQALREGKLISIPDVRQSGKLESLMPKAESLLSAPIKGRSRIYGVVTVGGSEPHQWNKEDKQTVVAIASLLASLVEQKTQLSGDIMMQLRRGRHLEQLMGKLRKPIARLLALQTKLLDEVHLLPSQRELMSEVEAIYKEIAEELGAPRTVKSSNESKLPPPPPPPKSPPVFGGKLGTSEKTVGEEDSTELGDDTLHCFGSGNL